MREVLAVALVQESAAVDGHDFAAGIHEVYFPEETIILDGGGRNRGYSTVFADKQRAAISWPSQNVLVAY
jgi:hypothetical protein